MKIWEPATARAREEVAEMQEYVRNEGAKFEIAPRDYYYYAEKLRQKNSSLTKTKSAPTSRLRMCAKASSLWPKDSTA